MPAFSLAACSLFAGDRVSAQEASKLLSTSIAILKMEGYSFPKKLSYALRSESKYSASSESSSSERSLSSESKIELDLENECFSCSEVETEITSSSYRRYSNVYLWRSGETYYYASYSRETQNGQTQSGEEPEQSCREIDEYVFSNYLNGFLNEKIPLAEQSAVISYYEGILSSTAYFPEEESSSSSASSSSKSSSSSKASPISEGERIGRRYQSTGTGNLIISYAYEKSQTNSSTKSSSVSGRGWKLSVDDNLPIRIESTSYSKSATETTNSASEQSNVYEYHWGVCSFQAPGIGQSQSEE